LAFGSAGSEAVEEVHNQQHPQWNLQVPCSQCSSSGSHADSVGAVKE
jgi:hypothetical protein